MMIDRSHQGRWIFAKLRRIVLRMSAIDAEMETIYREARSDGVDVATVKSVIRHRRRERAKVLRRA